MTTDRLQGTMAHDVCPKSGCTSEWKRCLYLTVLLTAALAFPSVSMSMDLYMGADQRYPGGGGGYEGSVASSHFHGQGGYHGFPNHWSEGHGLPSSLGHAGEVARYGRYPTPSGHRWAGYQIQRPFLAGAYGCRSRPLFLREED